MARNEEKAQLMLNWFFLASECCDFFEANKWPQQIMCEIGHKVAEKIQNEGLSENRLRDLNNETSRFIREKYPLGVLHRRASTTTITLAIHSAKMTDLEGTVVDIPNSVPASTTSALPRSSPVSTTTAAIAQWEMRERMG